jgi:arginase family enzyme
MKIKLGPKAWRKLLLDEVPDNIELIRSAFYLGYNIYRIEDLVKSNHNEEERVDIIRTAIILGMTDEDTVEFDGDVYP